MRHDGAIIEAIARGKVCSTELERQTEAFLNRLSLFSAEEIHEFLSLRQDLVTMLQNIDTLLEKVSEEAGISLDTALSADLREYRLFRRAAIQRVLALDARIIEGAGRGLESVQAGMTRVMQGKKAMRGYGESGEDACCNLNRTA